MAKSAGKNKVASFVEGQKESKVPRPKSLTPKIKAKDDKKRAGVYGKKGPY